MDYLLVPVNCIFHPCYAQFDFVLLLSLCYTFLNHMLLYLRLLLTQIVEDLQNHILLFLVLHIVAEAEEVFSNLIFNYL